MLLADWIKEESVRRSLTIHQIKYKLRNTLEYADRNIKRIGRSLYIKT